ncbi:MAG: DUF2279 domain-containing protein [Bacteroidia bacterium]
MKKTVFFLLMLLSFNFFSQTDSAKTFPKRKLIVSSTAGVAYTVSIIGLNQLWYKPYSNGSFHFFNDNNEWLQMDKIGHSFSTYQMGRGAIELMIWSGFKPKLAAWVGGMSGSIYMSTIEVMDGFSSGWGFSWGDMGANVGGSLLATSQHLIWKEQRIQLKYSFHQTPYPQYRPEILGTSLSDEFLKDYNGQTYWLSVNISSFVKKENSFPKWLNVALGYGADGMISGDPGYVIIQPDGKVLGNNRYRKYYISLDLDLGRIKTRNKILKTVFKVINIVKIPAPALEFSNKGIKGHAFFY